MCCTDRDELCVLNNKSTRNYLSTRVQYCFFREFYTIWFIFEQQRYQPCSSLLCHTIRLSIPFSLICESDGSIPKVPNSALCTIFGPYLVQITQFAYRPVIAYFPRGQIIPSIQSTGTNFDGPQTLHFFECWSHESGLFMTSSISYNFFAFVNIVERLWAKFLIRQIILETTVKDWMILLGEEVSHMEVRGQAQSVEADKIEKSEWK